MLKLLALSTIATISAANFLKAEEAWPQLNVFTTFQTEASLFTWDGKKLSPFKDITATIKADSDRNKIKIDAKVSIPIIGKVNAEVLVDLTQGVALEYVPFLGLCQKTPLNFTLSLKDTLEKIYSPTGGITVYDGEAAAPWDSTSMWKFHGSELTATITAWFDENSHNGKWIQEQTSDGQIPPIVVSIPKGEQPASFQDSDFTINGCKAYNENPAERINIWFDELKPEFQQ